MTPSSVGIELSPDQARAIAVTNSGPGTGDADPAHTLRSLGIIQLDTINAVARAHQLTLTARGTHLTAAEVDHTLWDTPELLAFDHPAHALALVPLHDWPLWAFRRRATRRRPDYPDPDTARALLTRIEQHGPLTMKQLRDNGEQGAGWNWSPTKTAVEFLVWAGELACVRRVNWQRRFELSHRVVPGQYLTDDLDDRQCQLKLLEHAGRVLGVATADDLADYIRIPTPLTRQLLPDTNLTPVTVHGWPTPAWAHPDALDHTAPAHRAVFLNPFDNLIWYRPRVARLFDFTHTLEAYKPAAKRVHGYYACPLLTGNRLVGRADLARRGTTLTVLQISIDTMADEILDGFAHACHTLARTTSCNGIEITDHATDPHTLRTLRNAIDQHDYDNGIS